MDRAIEEINIAYSNDPFDYATNAHLRLFIKDSDGKTRNICDDLDALEGAIDKIEDCLDMQLQLNDKYKQQIRDLQHRQDFHLGLMITFVIVFIAFTIVIMVVG